MRYAASLRGNMAQKLIRELHAPAPYGGLVVAERPRNYEPSARLSYRPDIDGLRAIAVIAVIAFHALPNTFRGGFIGESLVRSMDSLSHRDND